MKNSWHKWYLMALLTNRQRICWCLISHVPYLLSSGLIFTSWSISIPYSSKKYISEIKTCNKYFFHFPIPLVEPKVNRMNEPTGRPLGWQRDSLSPLREDYRERNCQKVSGRWAPTRWVPVPLSSPLPSPPLTPTSSFQLGQLTLSLDLCVSSREGGLCRRKAPGSSLGSAIMEQFSFFPEPSFTSSSVKCE